MWKSIGVLVFAATILLFNAIFWITGRNEPVDMRFVLSAVGILGLFVGWAPLQNDRRIVVLERALAERRWARLL